MSSKQEAKTLSERMRSFTREIHSKSDNTVNKQLAIAFTDRGLYGQAIALFYPIYREIEALIEANKDHPTLRPIFPYMPVLSRTSQFEIDLLFYCGAEWRLVAAKAEATPECSAYVRHLRSVAQSNPKHLLPYAYHMYMAIFAGGTMIKRMAKCTMGLADDAGTALFEFDFGKAPTKNDDGAKVTKSSFRQDFKAAIDQEAAGTLTEDDIIDVLHESHQVFERNNKLTQAFSGGYAVLLRKLLKYFVVVLAAVGVAVFVYNKTKHLGGGRAEL